MVSELDAYRTAKLILDQHGAQEAWRMLMERAVAESEAGRTEHLQITQQIIEAAGNLMKRSKTELTIKMICEKEPQHEG